MKRGMYYFPAQKCRQTQSILSGVVWRVPENSIRVAEAVQAMLAAHLPLDELRFIVSLPHQLVGRSVHNLCPINLALPYRALDGLAPLTTP